MPACPRLAHPHKALNVALTGAVGCIVRLFGKSFARIVAINAATSSYLPASFDVEVEQDEVGRRAVREEVLDDDISKLRSTEAEPD